jgi:putative FmdB family regulatory protein
LPLYDYQCKACQNVSEHRHGFREEYSGACPSCGSKDLARVFNPAPILFKGSGFYVTDSRSSSASANGSGDAKKSESKTSESSAA